MEAASGGSFLPPNAAGVRATALRHTSSKPGAGLSSALASATPALVTSTKVPAGE